MNIMDTLAGVSMGLYLLIVVVKGNTKDMLALASRDRGFLQWAIALGILWYLYSIPELRGPVSMLILAAFIGLGLMAGPNIIEQTKLFWSQLGGN